MINNHDFAIRLKKIIEYYDESASSFAEKIGVQRSSISHILSGRNKPSLDFIMKVLHTYPEVDLYWLMNGSGQFPKKDNSIIEVVKQNPKTQPTTTLQTENTQGIDTTKDEINLDSYSKNEKSIDRIVVFFKDGTFKNYSN